MKKILAIFITVITSLFLFACVDEQTSDTYQVKFYEENNLISEVSYEKDSLISLTDIGYEGDLEISHLVYKITGLKFDLNTKVTQDLDLRVVFIEVETYQVKFYLEDGTFLNEVSYLEDQVISLSDIKNDQDLEINYLKYKKNNITFNIENKVISNLELVVVFKEANATYYQVSFYLLEDDSFINEIEVKENTKLDISRINLSNHYEILSLYDYDTQMIIPFDVVVTSDLKILVEADYHESLNHEFNIFYLNDTHGAVLNKGNELGLAKIGNYIENERDDNSLFIAGGDMFQGQLISNDNRGAVMVEVFNHLKMDAFVIGNHEFDWGLEEIMVYFNDEENDVKANFPILGANVKLKSTNQRPEFIDSHVIIERGNVKIGIIGVMGDGLESSIATLRVKDYYFSNAYQAVLDTANQIQNQVDFILVVNHDNDEYFNTQVATINKVSAIFNGHTHWTYTGFINNSSGFDIPYIQSGSNGEKVGRVDLEFLQEDQTFTLTNSHAENISYHQHLNSEDVVIKGIVDSYYDELAHLYEETILISSERYSQADLAYYIAKIMAKSSDAVLGVQNSGGTRSTLYNQQEIKAADLFQVFPFDNLIIKADILGRDLKNFYDNNSFTYLDVQLSSIKDNEYYTIATNDYLFYQSYNQNNFFSGARNVEEVADMYEKFYETLYRLKESGKTYFDTNDEIDFWN